MAADTWGLLRCYGTVGTNLTSSNSCITVTKDVACDQVDPAHDEDDYSRGNDNLPECQAERLLIGLRLVKVAEHIDAQDYHGERKSDEAVTGAEQRPVAREPTSKERQLRNQEEH